MYKNVGIQNKLRTSRIRRHRSNVGAAQFEPSILDAVVHESLRMHPPVQEIRRVVRILPFSDSATESGPQLTSFVGAAEDVILPLATPVVTKSGEMTNSIFVAKGTLLTAPIQTLDVSEKIWGPDAKEFKL
ncbi:uncharacterized protein EV420DRAFT_1552211 [Desarmillaria tabescens]|uniref:Uncharacterized protein n=1 Tax=Armillaria tabescens TaxID=1929756 RepID=A0AA39K6R4_ARMTA|nr:uncharacterized protein EV420DRAFT_1552211 [Desarmillaria tabescens]KAK0455609.1 hypothetical protein EV420DRAFT_1552211 [Desarmillaria tabescens]